MAPETDPHGPTDDGVVAVHGQRPAVTPPPAASARPRSSTVPAPRAAVGARQQAQQLDEPVCGPWAEAAIAQRRPRIGLDRPPLPVGAAG